MLFIAISSIVLLYCDWQRNKLEKEFVKIDGDGKDYYSYLTSAFITNDLAHLKSENNFVVETPTGNIKMHTVGVAIMQLPFFILGYIVAKVGNYSLDGFSAPFQLAISLAGLCYALIGLYFIMKTLYNLKYSKTVVLVSVLILFFGTSLLTYTITEPSMSHVYSFALISAFIYFNQKLADKYSAKTIYTIAVLLGLIILVRPVNLLVIFLIPYFYGSLKEIRNRMSDIFQNRKALIISIGLAISVCFIQSFIWFLQTGSFYQNSYVGNGFYFFKPHIFDMLFGFNSGIIVYSPMLLLVFVGLYLNFKSNKFKGLSILFFLFFIIYVFSCYWGWTYFDGLGTRAIVDFYGVFAILIALVINSVKNNFQKVVLTSIVVFFVIFNLIISFQFKEGIIQVCGMNYEKYKYVLFKIAPQYKGVLGGCYDLMPYSSEKKTPFLVSENNYDYVKNKFYLYNGNEFGVEYKATNINVEAKKIHLKVAVDRFDIKANSSKNALISVSLNDKNNKSKVWQTFKLNDTPSTDSLSNWKHYDYSINIAANIKPSDIVCVSVWNPQHQTFGIDNFKVELYNYN